MITNILFTKGYDRGYLPKMDSAMIQPIFATANLAVRREAIREVGLFDTQFKTGEDVELGIRFAKTKWELFFEPRAIIHHKHRTTLSGLLRQWYKYGSYHPFIFKKHTPRSVKIYLPTRKSSGWSSIQCSSFLGLPLPMHALIFVTPFHILNVLFIAMLISLFTKTYTALIFLSSAWLLVWLFFCARLTFQSWAVSKKSRWIVYTLLRYLLNWTYVLGALWGGLKIGVLYVEATREQTPPV
jgi:cellulose synthase/poly-beta-1,6-N-acetylglucosamine synthase-like glycosyltransferase